MNILFRYGEFHNLTFALPPAPYINFWYPNLFSASSVNGFSEQQNKTFNIMCHHMRFRYTEVEKVMSNDTFYFTVLRNPVTQMESSFSYFKGFSTFRKCKSLEDFLENADEYYDANRTGSYFAKNCQTFDLGFNHNGPNTTKNIELICEEVGKIFHLVLIAEYFDESLILLKEALCWSYEDVLSFPLNKRSNTTKKALSLERQEKIKHWNNLDWQLYSYFNRSFWKHVERFGQEQMDYEIQKLQRKRDEMAKICLQDEVDPNQLQDKSLMPYQSGLARILGYNLKPDLPSRYKLLCQRLVTPELQYSYLLYNTIKEKAPTDVTITTKPEG
ncbi:galactose-3-O-sulfotransferase 2-like [Hyperolius riggenbachi]|uniref:galactose-3-O-sulfotransferase 2-like n=1 Tax=Hyperolius riggenbachi TaxID=752182 RepID=UPI0035A39CE0